jgi:pilus assembly protein FimV
LPLARTPEATKLIAKSHRWQKTALAAAAVALLGLSGTEVLALSLGRLTVQSALGEPLRAEIEVPDINAEEASSLRANVAAPEAFTAAGMEYNPAMSNLQVSLQRRANGTAYIRLSSSRPINDPFVDMILEASWASGRIVRDYTMLFDPPVLRQAQVTPTLPQTSPAPSVPAPVRAATAPVSNDTPRSAPVAKAPAPKAAAPATAAPSKPLTALGAEGDKQITVKNGDNASKIAARTKAANVSLDQMLVALLRANPDAFVNSNLNRIRAGTVMNVPTAEQAQSVPAAEASQIVVAQSKDFNDFRRNLAANAPSAGVPAADRKASGSVDAKVEDKKPASTAPDKLTLSKGAVQSKAADDAKIAKERAEKDAATRAAEIAKNISDLDKMKAASAPKTATAPAPAASETSKAATSAPAVAVTTTPPPAPAASAPVAPVAAASAPQAAVSAPAKPKAAPVVAAPVEEPALLDELLGDPLVPAAAGGLLALLGGLAFYKIRQRKKNAAQVDSSFLESRLQPDSFFGASGGQRVDTANDGPASNSSMVYSASQLDAADDVDPVAEADVYLAYGRDLQAEEILKEAVRTNPGRLAIHTKLLEIFAKRRDAQGFEASATQAFKLTGSASPEWARICEMGLAFDPENPLYQPGGTPSAVSSAGASESAGASAFGTSTVAQSAHPDLADNRPGVDLDLDLDFSLDDEPASAISDVTGGTVAESKPEQTLKMEAPEQDSAASLDFDISGPAALEPTPELPNISLSMDGLSLGGSDDAGVNFDATSPMQVAAPAAEPAVEKDTGMLEFDMGSLSLDLDPTPSEQPSESPTSAGEDPLETKLALAEEFVSIGDEDGARALIEEVVAEASGEMRAKAQRALANLS